MALLFLIIYVRSSNLSYKISLWKSLLCDVLVFLDNDEAGKEAFNKAKEKDLVSENEVFFSMIRGYDESEIEDFIDINANKQRILKETHVELRGNVFRNSRRNGLTESRTRFILIEKDVIVKKKRR